MFPRWWKLFRAFQTCSGWIIRIRPFCFARVFGRAALRGMKSTPRYDRPLLFGLTAYCLTIDIEGIVKSPRDNTSDLLLDAVMRSDLDCLRKHLKTGVDPDKRHTYGWTPLHSAAFQGKTE